MILFLLEILCSFLIAMSLVFISIQIKARFDKSFLIFGISNLLLCSFSAIDIWLQPTTQILHWTEIQHIIASFFPTFILWYIFLVVQKENMNFIKMFIIISSLFSVLFLSGKMLIPVGNEVISTSLYNILFAPYMVLSIIGILVLNFYFIKNASPHQKRFMLFHLVGIFILATGGILDMLAVIRGARVSNTIPNFSIIGILCFCSVVDVIFIDKLTSIIMEREITLKKLREAYKELENVQALKELGQSTAMINHEIRNYAVAISGYAELLLMKGELSEFSKKMTNRIKDAIINMTNFSKDILEFSKSNVIKNKISIELLVVLRSCIERNFDKEIERFEFDYKSNVSFVVNGDWQKLDQVFLNIFRNAFEAKASKITLKLRQTHTTVQCEIIDDGVGCNEESLKNFFKAFHTTKKEGGTGLGLCVVRSIIESHGGRISAYTNNDGNGKHGLGIHMVFPRYTEVKKGCEEYKNGIIFITQGISELSVPLQVFRNTLISPYIFKNAKEIESEIELKNSYALLATAESIQQFNYRFKIDNITKYVLVEDSSSGLYVVDENGEMLPEKFSEEFIFKNLLIKEYVC